MRYAEGLGQLIKIKFIMKLNRFDENSKVSLKIKNDQERVRGQDQKKLIGDYKNWMALPIGRKLGAKLT
ncbi:MAG: hypothetical protein HOB18_15180 [Nitrospina sp.]|nr:hypothetical protein [Nitrospina sp.]